MQTASERGRGRDHIGGVEFALFAGILTAAMAARLWNIGWGLPDVFEEATPFTIAARFWGPPGGHLSLLPDFYHYPALSFYVHFAVQGAYWLAGAVTGAYPTLDAFRSALAADPGSFMVGARLASALLDVGTVALVWLIAREHFGGGIAAGAALLAAFNPLQLANAQGVNVDVVTTFCVMLALRKSLSLNGHASGRDFAVAGALIGVAASAKYTGVLFLAVPVFVIGADFIAGTARTVRFALREAGLALLVPLCAAAVFAALNPGILLDPGAFLRDFTYEQQHMEYGHLGLDPGQGSAAFYIATTILGGFGPVFLAGAVAGIVVSAAGRNAAGLAIGAMTVIYIAVISTWEMHAERYLLPAVPMLAILCSAGCVRALAWAAARSTGTGMLSRFRPFLLRALPAAAIAGALAVPAAGSVLHLVDLGRTDTRTTAREWITGNVRPGSIIVSGPYGVAIPRESAMVVGIPFAATGAEATAPFYDTRWFEDFELLIASDYDIGRYRREPERFAPMLRYDEELRANWRLLAEFAPDTAHRGPTLWFYAPPSTATSDTFPDDLLRGLASVDNADLVSQFIQNLSGALYARARYGKCRQLLEFGLRLNPADRNLTGLAAFVLYKSGLPAEALAMIDRADREGGGGSELLLLKGTILMQAGDDEGAERALLRAAELRPEMPLPYALLIDIYRRTGDGNRLAGILTKYLAVAPPGGPEARTAAAMLDSLKSAR